MESTTNSDICFPRHKWRASDDSVFDQEFHEFDAQAERLTGHDQDYMQLTDGRFHGRFVSCFLGSGTSLHFERANQALSQNIAASDTYSVGVPLFAPSAFRADGVEVDGGSIFLVPPKTSFHLYSPRVGAILACVIDKETLDSKLSHAPHVRGWIQQLGSRVGSVRAPMLADRLRQDAISALRAVCLQPQPSISNARLGQALVDSFVAGLILEFGSNARPMDQTPSNTFQRFSLVTSNLDSQKDSPSSVAEMSRALGVSKRSLQYAFASEVCLGVSCYLRRARLRAVRRSLMDVDSMASSIGDIAAQHGYWNWSHFSQQYSKHFGERPSDTRLRLSGQSRNI